MLVYVVMHGGQLLLLEAAYRYTYTRVTLRQVAAILGFFLPIFLCPQDYSKCLYFAP
jgi:hypothetical protein